jgi:hypothetical protein
MESLPCAFPEAHGSGFDTSRTPQLCHGIRVGILADSRRCKSPLAQSFALTPVRLCASKATIPGFALNLPLSFSGNLSQPAIRTWFTDHFLEEYRIEIEQS